MAFFKFRFPGQDAASSASAEMAASGPGESIEVVRRRARHRLMGAVVLVLVAVVGFPLLFDTQPRPVAVDTPILIPDRQKAGPLSAAEPAERLAPAKPLLPDARPLPAQAGLEPNETLIQPPPVLAETVTKPAKPAPLPDLKPAASKSDKSEASAAAAQAKTRAKVNEDGSKARALLEGKSPSSSKPASNERLVVQVGAFTDPAKVREVRRKLEQAGLVTFTQVIDGKDGKSTTRIRVGPFSSREDAEKAAARIRKLSFSPAVLRL